ncbi:mechanosensitive ion channel family protein [Kozakia baliensis]|uniref:mechanosensitive ion channel family protein n=1 Tax=Kozakia baliensis TaxID=153496 RepID=UPI00049810E2|nr:mechanosensitive ion channel domain-containing protein [Kozakia baliensis]
MREKKISAKRQEQTKKPFFHILVILAAITCLWTHGARAADPSPSDTPPALTSAQAQQLLGVLNDDTKRRQFATTLQNFVKAQAKTGNTPSAPTTASTPTATPAAPTPPAKQLRPNSLGAELLSSLSNFSETGRHKANALLNTIIDFREVPRWARHVARDASLRAEMTGILFRAAIFAGLAAGLVILARFLIWKPKAKLAEMARRHGLDDLVRVRQEQAAAAEAARHDAYVQEAAAQTAAEHSEVDPAKDHLADQTQTIPPHNPPPPVDDAEAEQEARMRHQGALARLLLAVRRVPFALGNLLLDAISVSMIPLAAALVIWIDPSNDEAIEAALRDMAAIGVFGSSIVCVARALLAPAQPWLRLLTISNWAADYIFSWVRLIVMVIMIGGAVINLLDDCSLPVAIVTALTKVLALVVHLLVAVMILRSRTHVMAVCRRISQSAYASRMFLLLGRVWWIAALFFDMGLWLVWAAEIRNGYSTIWAIFLRSVVALVMVRVISIAAYGLLERFFRLAPQWAALSDDTKARLSLYYPIARRILGLIVTLVTVLALFVAWGTPMGTLFSPGGIGSRTLSSITTVIIELVIAAGIWEWTNVALDRYVKRADSWNDGPARIARIRTLQPMLRIILLVVLAIIIGLTILSQIGVNTAPLLAGASIFGVALGFGSQKLVQDFISGIFLLMENALTVGDTVTLNGTGGVVERLSLRTVHVRGGDGSMNIFPFSSLGQITNFNRDYANAMIVAKVGYDTDTDQVVAALNDITSSMREDETFKDWITNDFQLWGVDSLNDTSVSILGTVPTTTGGRWPVQREFNRRMKKIFQERGFTVPFPTQKVEIAGLAAWAERAGPKASIGES